MNIVLTVRRQFDKKDVFVRLVRREHFNSRAAVCGLRRCDVGGGTAYIGMGSS